MADGNVVTVTCKASANYVLTSNSQTVNGSFALKKNTMGNIITLDDCRLTYASGVESKGISGAKEGTTFVVVKDKTVNSIKSYKKCLDFGQDPTEEGNEDFTGGDVVISGSGKLTMQSDAKGCLYSEGGYVYLHKGTILNITPAEGKNGIAGYTGVTVGGGVQNITLSGGYYDEDEKSAETSKGIKSDTGTLKFLGGRTTVINSGTAIYDKVEKDYSAAACVKADDIYVDGGTLLCYAKGNGGKGIRAGNNMTVASGTIEVITEGKNLANNDDNTYDSSDAIDKKYPNTTVVDANPKAIHVGDKDADPITGELLITGGSIKVRSMYSEGIESKKTMTISGGKVQVYATDDAINAGVSEKANDSIVISGGTIYAYGANNDGIDSNGTITISGGTVFSSGTTGAEEGLDCDQNTFKITGGTIIGLGGSTSTPTSNVCSQPSLITTATISNGAIITLAINDTDVVSFKCPRAYSSATILISGDGSSQGNTYKLYCGSTTLSSGTLSSMVNGSTGGGGGGTQPGGGGGNIPGGGGGRPF